MTAEEAQALIDAAAQQPAAVSTNAGRVESRPLTELIDYARFVSSSEAASGSASSTPGAGVKFSKIRHRSTQG